MEKEVGREVIDVGTIGNRIIAAKIPAIPVDMYIIQVYMPTSRHDEQEIETINDQLEELIRDIPTRNNLILMGDWNAIVG